MKIIPSKDVPPPDPNAPEGLLGPFLPEPPGLVLHSGETSAGKTVWAYNVAYHIAEGKEFTGLTPTSPLRVLYIDLESPEQVHRSLVQAIGTSDNLLFAREMPRLLSSTAGQDELMNDIREWNVRVVFIDPLSVAWPVRDENDNAEADRQMWRIKEIAVATGTLIVALWNMGEGQMKAKWRARGATARLDRVDLALNYTELSETERRLVIVKSRYGTLGRDMTVRFAGEYGFEAARVVSIAAPSQTQVIEAHIMNLVSQRPHSRQEVLAALGQVGITNENLIDKALRDLCVRGKLRRTGRGMYALPESSDPQ